MAVINQRGTRDAFARARANLVAAYVESGQSPANAALAAQNAVLTRSYLRLEQPVVVGATSVLFPVLINQNNSGNAVRATEQRLNQQDAFFVTDTAFYLGKASSAADASFFPSTFPDAVTFPTGSATGNLYTIYNGWLHLTVNGSVIIPAQPLLDYLQIPQTQLTGAATPPQTQFDPAQVSLQEPMINLIGTKKNTLGFTLPAGIAAVDTFTYYVLILRGVLAQNVTLMS